MLVQTYLYLILSFVLSINQVLATSCQEYSTEYAYRDDSVTRTESASANCRSYPPGNLQAGEHPEHYIHCDGTQLKLTDSEFGQEQYQSSHYYEWTTGSAKQLLFIFSKRVPLTTITLHYYSDSVRGRPRLRFYAVPDDFDIWNTLTTVTNTPHKDVASVPSGEGPTGHRSISININFNTKKVLMYKFSSDFQFAVSEMEFMQACTTIISTTTISSSSQTSSVRTLPHTETINETLNDSTTKDSSTKIMNTSTGTTMLRGRSQTVIIAIGVFTVGLLILSSALIIAAIVVIRNYRRRSAKQQLDTDAPYLTLNRSSRLQTQPQYIQQNSNELYDQIHLSPFTGQAEFISKPQSENTNNPPYNSHPTHLDTEISGNNATAALHIMDTHAAIGKSNKKDDTKHTAAEKYTTEKYIPNVSSSKQVHAKGKENSKKRNQKSLDQERVNSVQESSLPHSVEELYTAVKKKPKDSSAPVNESVSQVAEDLYTAVMKKPKQKSVNDEVAPPIPPYMVEKLYTAVHKMPARNTMEDEEKAPPIPPLTVEDI